MKRSAQKRYCAAADVYQNMVGRPFTSDEIANWMIAERLYPVPTIRNSPDEQRVWEERFAEVSARIGEVKHG
jgi:hypothetical protein